MISELMCLATAIFFEARGEPLEGQYAVADVIMNRVEDSRYPDNVCDVVNEPKQFSYTHDGASDDPQSLTNVLDKRAWGVAQEVATDALTGAPRVYKATHYLKVGIDTSWSKSYVYEGTVGQHKFYINNTKYR